MVIEGDGPSLLGREWLTHIQLDWPEIHVSKVLSVTVKPDTERSLKKLLHSYQEVFTDRVEVMKHHRAKLHLKEGAQPRYHRARPVPFANRDKVAKELDRLEGMGILERLETSAWAAPIVVVPKKDGHLRLCGDYKVTINLHLKINSHPLPRAEEMFSKLAGGEKFTKLDLSHTYQQMALEESSKELVTVNTHQGLYHYTRLPSGVASAPAIFQRTMDDILQGMERVACFIDDILITGVNDEDHLRRLQEVLERLRQHGIVVKKMHIFR